MSENLQGHLIKYKVGDEWVEIPLAIVNVYDTYVAYCEQNAIEPVSESEYYVTLGNVKQYAEQLAGSTESIAALTSALGEEGVLPVTFGGTGHSFTNEYKLLDWFKNELHLAGLPTNEDLENTEQSLQTKIDAKLDKTVITYGTEEPNESTAGSFYFQYKA